VLFRSSEKAILRLSLMAIVLGLAGIYLTILFTEPESVPLSDINDSLVGKIIATEGQISSFRISNTSTAFITLADKGKEISVIKFNSAEEGFKKGEVVLVSGEVTKYQGKLEIVARQIKLN
jgi:DNA/RNA endonuclease YhcR with UshA esterase domain